MKVKKIKIEKISNVTFTDEEKEFLLEFWNTLCELSDVSSVDIAEVYEDALDCLAEKGNNVWEVSDYYEN